MSVVTNAVLTYSILEESDRIEEVNAGLASAAGARAQGFGEDIMEVDDSAVVGGYKMFEAPLHLAAFNHLEPERIIEVLVKVAWKYPEQVQLWAKGQHDVVFSLHTLERHAPGEA